jgi:hypothetical protein
MPAVHATLALLTALALLATALPSQAAPPPPCAAEAVTQARKLLAFHFGEDERIEVETTATALPPLRNPANTQQRFQVLEVWGHIYKGRYRMRLLYYPMDSGCVLMGQEILEHASL